MSAPRYKEDYIGQRMMLDVDFKLQIRHGSIEWAIEFLVDNVLDLTAMHGRYKNHHTGCTAYDPAILLKIVLLAYSRGTLSSRDIALLCAENITFIALSGDTRPSFRTIAGFISSMPEVIESLFTDVLAYCDELGLINGEMFAVDGCKLPSNASKERSGRHDKLQDRLAKYREQVKKLMQSHAQHDLLGDQDDGAAAEQAAKTAAKIIRFKEEIDQLEDFLAGEAPRKGSSGKEVQSNLTDNESAKMQTSHGVLQGFNGVAVADAGSQIVVHADVNGAGPENDQLIPALEGTAKQLDAIGYKTALSDIPITADSGFHSDKAMADLEAKNIDGYIADNQMRQRDPDFDSQGKYKTEHRKARRKQRLQEQDREQEAYPSSAFEYDQDTGKCYCPQGYPMKSNGKPVGKDGTLFHAFKGDEHECKYCHIRHECLQKPEQNSPRQIRIPIGSITLPPKEPTAADRMRDKIDSPEGKQIYSRRIATIEPVFGNHRNHRRDKFTLRGQEKVSAQWKQFNLVHNIGKAQVSGRMALKCR